MEGLAYWIFLAAFYLLSAFMKKRREQGSDSDTSSEKKSNIFQNQFFQDMFQDMKEIDVEPEELSLEEDSYLEEDNSLEEYNSLEEEPIFKDLSNEYELQLIPFLLEGVAQKPEFNLSDGMHPNDKGTIIISKTLKEAILKNL